MKTEHLYKKNTRGLNSIKIDTDEMKKLNLNEGQYRQYRKLMDFTQIKNLPPELAEFYLNRTGFKITSLKVDLEWAMEVFADFVRGKSEEDSPSSL